MNDIDRDEIEYTHNNNMAGKEIDDVSKQVLIYFFISIFFSIFDRINIQEMYDFPLFFGVCQFQFLKHKTRHKIEIDKQRKNNKKGN